LKLLREQIRGKNTREVYTGDAVDEVLRGRLEEVRATLEEILERSDRGIEGAAQRGLGEGPASDTAPSAQEEQ
jgi:hypothetical protein